MTSFIDLFLTKVHWSKVGQLGIASGTEKIVYDLLAPHDRKVGYMGFRINEEVTNLHRISSRLYGMKHSAAQRRYDGKDLIGVFSVQIYVKRKSGSYPCLITAVENPDAALDWFPLHDTSEKRHYCARTVETTGTPTASPLRRLLVKRRGSDVEWINEVPQKWKETLFRKDVVILRIECRGDQDFL